MPPADRPAGSRPTASKPPSSKPPVKKPAKSSKPVGASAPRKPSVSNPAAHKRPARPIYELQTKRSPLRTVGIVAGSVVVIVSGVMGGLYSTGKWHPNLPEPIRIITGQTHMTRPYGMAPVAYEGYMRACNNAGVSPFRIGQTIGDFPMSVGYHHADGKIKVGNTSVDYTAAVDIGGSDLAPDVRKRFLDALTKQGFACWYREKGKWKGHEHIHAIYALLPMKPQLRDQVREFLVERRGRGVKELHWEKVATKKLS